MRLLPRHKKKKNGHQLYPNLRGPNRHHKQLAQALPKAGDSVSNCTDRSRLCSLVYAPSTLVRNMKIYVICTQVVVKSNIGTFAYPETRRFEKRRIQSTLQISYPPCYHATDRTKIRVITTWRAYDNADDPMITIKHADVKIFVNIV